MLGLAAAAAPQLRARAADAVNLRVTWWGSQERIRRTTASFSLYHERNPSVTLTGEPASSDYWPKIATQVAGRNLADIFQLDHLSLADYAKRGAARQLDSYAPSPLNLAALPEQVRALGQIGGKTYGVAQGVNAYSIAIDATVIEGAGLKPPTFSTSWTEYADLAVELTKAVGKPSYWGSTDASGHYYALDPWLLQRGKSIYKDDGSGVNFSADDLTEWFSYWADMRKRGGCVSADVASIDDGQIPNTPMARGNTAMDFGFSNYMIAYQAITKNRMDLAPVPQAPGAPPSLYLRPALIWAVASNSRNPEAAAAFINWFVTNPDSAKIIGVERGVPGLPASRDVVLADMTPAERTTVDYLKSLEGKFATFRYWPVGGNEYDHAVLRPTAQLVAFGKITPAEGARKLVSEAKSIFA